MRCWSLKAQQIVHLQSGLEFAALLSADFNSNVMELKEQIALPRAVTRAIAERHCVRHPQYPGTKVCVVMTTDFLLKFRGPDRDIDVAWSVKPSSEIDASNITNLRTLEKLAIEQEYWVNRGAQWAVITEKHFDRTLLANIEWMWPAVTDPKFECGHRQLKEMAAKVMMLWREDRPLDDIAMTAARSLHLNRQVAIARIYRCIWDRMLHVDLAAADLHEMRPLLLLPRCKGVGR